jgi:hypothetical protein
MIVARLASMFVPGASRRTPAWAWAVAAVLAVALPDCGGTKYTTTQPSPPPTTLPPVTPPPAPTTLADLSATVTSPQADASINCDAEVRARISVANRGGTAVAVSSFIHNSGVAAGDCFGSGDRTFRYNPPRPVAGNGTTVIFDGSLFSGINACCNGKGCAGACTFQADFRVFTDLGEVYAGAFKYKVFFQNCASCPGSVTTQGVGCARATAIPLDAQR